MNEIDSGGHSPSDDADSDHKMAVGPDSSSGVASAGDMVEPKGPADAAVDAVTTVELTVELTVETTVEPALADLARGDLDQSGTGAQKS